ncbi:endoribonuclease Dicer-like, partial [Watersipora subatra]|uniref:endoribonuclease Dicer-like n=1 Tax=Watersipora subatra TaxID=2589382 RepID=UPI00355B8282
MKPKKPRAPRFILEDRLTPPTYQVQLVCSALNHNTVLCVSHEAGLSFLPIMLIKALFEKRSSNDEDKRISVYLSPDGDESRCEVNMQRVKIHSILRVNTVTDGSCLTDCMNTSDVLCMPASLCLGLVQSGALGFQQINLVVFDECHVAVEPDSPYAALVSLLKNSLYFDSVRLFGITSSIIGDYLEQPAELEWKISQLESVLASTAATTSDLNAMDTPAGKREEIIAVYDDSDNTCESLTEEIRATLQHAYHFLGDMKISQADVVRSREEMVGKKPKTKVDTKTEATKGETEATKGDVLEPAENSIEWYNLQIFKEAPRKVFKEVEMTLDELGPWCAACVALNLCATLEKIIDKTTERLEKQLLQLAWTQLQYIHMLVKQRTEAIYEYTELLEMSSPKVRQLIEVLKTYVPKVDFEITSAISSHDRSLNLTYSDFSDLSDGESLQDQETFTIAKMKHSGETDHVVKVNQEETTILGLVFVNRKLSAYALHKYIEDLCIWDRDMYFIRSSYMIDVEEDGDDRGKTRKQEQRLLQFRQRKVNLLVGTSILESSLDLPKCNLVCMFDKPESYKSYISVKNRAKASNAKYYCLCSSHEKESFEKYMGDFQKIEMILQSKCHEFDPA